ncbi:MAG TPA: hypothetical protein VER68_09725, partial [Azonexus sp.]|nr:hypothetical protein [Azonexus sp.]
GLAVNHQPGFAKIPTARSKTMGKERHGTKEAKKEAVLTKKEKKTAKQVKKQGKDVIHPLTGR